MVASDSADRTVRVMALHLDALTLGRLRSTTRGTELVIDPVSPEDALDHAGTAAGPFVVLLEWSQEGEAEQTRFCKALRRAAARNHCFIVALGGLSDASLQLAQQNVVDDVLTRPFGEEVLHRLRQAMQSIQAARARMTARNALDEALASPVGGDVVVRSGEAVGRIHVQSGGVVWANLSSAPATMEDIVRRAGLELDPEVVAATKSESQVTRTHFMDVLVAWGHIDRQRAREAVRAFVDERVKLVLELPDASALFLPGARPHTPHLRFSAEEIPSSRPPMQRSVTPFPTQHFNPRAALPPEVSGAFQEALALDGVLSVAILDRRSGVSLIASGVEVDPSVAWSQLSLLAALGDTAEDVIATRADRCFIARPLRLAPTAVLFVCLGQSTTTLGLARALIARIATKSTAAPED